ncbi:MAG TPA: N-acetylmuramoyl-L-alanine amidase, partial [Herpetosiphonaceae bacterium]|nr:N-acetylmuramoyl-L-alanine amidase [Herpetosiphonaceae bacterium]
MTLRSVIRASIGTAGGALLLGLAACAAQPEAIAPPPPVAQLAATQAAPATATALPPTLTQRVPAPTLAPAATATLLAPQPTGTPASTPTPAVPRVGIQVGHWKTEELPEELARFRTSTGAFAAGVSELEVNLAVAERVKAFLEAEGVLVDLLPATVPVAYQADAFVTIHADGSAGTGASGFKMATPWRTSPASGQLYDALMAEYAA